MASPAMLFGIHRLNTFLLICVFGFYSTLALAGRMERTGGDYILSQVSDVCSNSTAKKRCFRIVFKSKVKSGRFDILTLESDHMSANLQVGSEVRLSAEIAVDRGASAEVAQVVVFRNAKESNSSQPVWLLSSKHKAGPGPAARYIEMHLPQSDFSIL